MMPVLIGLHERFAGKGLAIIGVHVDKQDTLVTTDKFLAAIAPAVRNALKGKSLPFPNALVAGKDDRISKLYGVDLYPTTILIDRDGKVVRKFKANDLKAATEEIERLLGTKK